MYGASHTHSNLLFMWRQIAIQWLKLQFRLCYSFRLGMRISQIWRGVLVATMYLVALFLQTGSILFPKIGCFHVLAVEFFQSKSSFFYAIVIVPMTEELFDRIATESFWDALPRIKKQLARSSKKKRDSDCPTGETKGRK
jgi:hypothetical protein